MKSIEREWETYYHMYTCVGSIHIVMYTCVMKCEVINRTYLGISIVV